MVFLCWGVRECVGFVRARVAFFLCVYSVGCVGLPPCLFMVMFRVRLRRRRTAGGSVRVFCGVIVGFRMDYVRFDHH